MSAGKTAKSGNSQSWYINTAIIDVKNQKQSTKLKTFTLPVMNFAIAYHVQGAILRNTAIAGSCF